MLPTNRAARPCLGRGSPPGATLRILVFGAGALGSLYASGPKALMAALRPERLLLGFPGASGVRDGERMRFRLIPQRRTSLGEPSGRITPRLREVAAALHSAGFPVALSRRMDAWLKTHAVFVTAVAGAIYDAGGTCAALVSQPGGVARLVYAVRQGFKALRAREACRSCRASWPCCSSGCRSRSLSPIGAATSCNRPPILFSRAICGPPGGDAGAVAAGAGVDRGHRRIRARTQQGVGRGGKASGQPLRRRCVT